jgi:hypothetical protein
MPIVGNRWLPQTTYAVGCSGGRSPPSPPAEKTTARQDAGQASTGDAAVIRHFQERMPYGLFVPDVDSGVE